jgi:hypothetical protein
VLSFAPMPILDQLIMWSIGQKILILEDVLSPADALPLFPPPGFTAAKAKRLVKVVFRPLPGSVKGKWRIR